MSFPLWTVFAEQENPVPRELSENRGLRYLQTTDELGAQVALLQSLIPPVVAPFYQLEA